MRDAIDSHPKFTKLLVYFKKGQAGTQVFLLFFFKPRLMGLKCK